MASASHSHLPFAAERYVLNELSDDEKLSFEEHFFSCESCAQEVEDLTAIRLAIPRELPALGRKSAKWAPGNWMPLLWANRFAFSALALLVMVAGYQNIYQIPHLKAQADDTFALMPTPRLLSASRAADARVIDGKLQSAPIVIRNEWLVDYSGYQVRLSRHGSAAILHQSKFMKIAGDLTVTIPAREIGPGQFDVLILGKPLEGDPEIVRRFVVTVQGD